MILLSAALDLVGPDVPKGVVLLADVIPSFLTKLIAPYFMHLVPYSIRVVIFVFLSVVGMLIVAMSPSYTEGGAIASKIAGIILASLSAGGGELSFMGLTHYYGQFSLAAWSSGTGAAGLVGAGAYALATNTIGISVNATLFASACLPAIMVVSFFVILPRDPLRAASPDSYISVERGEHPGVDEADEAGIESEREEGIESEREESEGLLGVSVHSDTPKSVQINVEAFWWDHMQKNMQQLGKLFFPL